jgi:hypothetical protein
MPVREDLKAEVERIALANNHTLGPWLDVGHASQIGCVSCDKYGFVEVMPPPGKLHLESLEAACPSPHPRPIV